MIKSIAGINYIETDSAKYVADLNNNAVCRIDRNEVSGRVLIYDKSMEYDKDYCWAKCARIDSKILFAPCKGSVLCLYDEKTDQCVELDIEFDELKDEYELRFWEVAVYDRFFYVMGYSYPGIIKVDSQTGKYSCLTECADEIKQGIKANDKWNYYFASGCASFNDEYYFSTGIDSTLFCLNCRNDDYRLITLDCGIRKIWDISNDGDWIWMNDIDPNTGRVAKWNRRTNEIVKLSLPSKGVWHAPLFYEDQALFFPCINEAKAYRVGINDQKIEVFEKLDELFYDKEDKCVDMDTDDNDSRRRGANAIMIKMDYDRIVFIRHPDLTWFSYDLKTEELSRFSYVIDDKPYLDGLYKEHYDRKYNELIGNTDIILEEQFPLAEYLKRV